MPTYIHRIAPAVRMETTMMGEVSKQIVILDRGFVLVGDVRVEGDWVVTENASIIRRWGTTKGLGEIAAGGPTRDTKLDPIGTMKSPLRALIGLVACEGSKWTP